MDVDNVLMAVGQMVDLSIIGEGTGLEMNPWGTLKVDPITLETSAERIFSGGDAAVGGGTIIEAIAAGKEAAISIDRYIRGENLRAGRGEVEEPVQIPLEGIEPMAKVPMRFLPIEERVDNFREVELGYTEEMATAGLSAPLHPGAAKYYKEKGWIE